ncbi:MAG: acyl-CoA dehydrogenase family protein [SAR324 cluster bacterium]|nr:acyl-CoA dehydrogenase family protein [SAR324 cluster bacterium]
MEENFTESHRLLRQMLRNFVQREIMPHINEWEEAELFPGELYKKAAECGLLSIGFEEKYGGVESDIFHTIVVGEELSRSGSGGIVAGLGSLGIGLPPIQHLGTHEQKQRFISPVLAGDKIAALAITEPNTGSDVASIETRAVRDGDYYIVNGSKMFITSGTRADIITTAVRTGGAGHAGVSMLVIESDSPGFHVSKKLKKMGWRCSDTAELSFQDCRVPVANLLGNEGDGFLAIMQNFEQERLSLAVMAYSSALLAWEESLNYAKQRVVFGKPLISKQVIRHKLAQMLTKVEIARDYVYSVAARMKAGQKCIREISMAKNFAVEVCDYVANEAVQIHGGMGYMRECVVERIYRDSRILGIGGGTNEIMNEIICKTSGIG